MYIDSKKLNQAFNQEENHKAFHQIINDFAKVIEELIGYKGPINTEIDQIIQNGKKHENKINSIQEKLRMTQLKTYKQLANLEGKIAHANYTIQLLEEQMRSYSNNC